MLILPGLVLGISDELGDRLGREPMDSPPTTSGYDNNASDRRDVAAEIETKLFVQRSIDRVCRSDQEERVAILRAHARRPRWRYCCLRPAGSR